MSCPDCFSGAIMTDYKPKGTMETQHSLPTYMARPTGQPKGIIIIIPDAFGLPFLNNKHLADTYASHGYLTYLPDFMNGAPAPTWMIYTFANVFATNTWWDYISKPYHVAMALYGFVPFTLRNTFGKTMPVVKTYFEAVRSANPSLPIGAAGFCWGGLHAIYLAHGLRASTGKLYADASFTAHPSNVTMPGDLDQVTHPLSIAIGTADGVFTPAMAKQTETILRQKTSEQGLKHAEIVFYEGAGHGFGVRADPGNKEVAKHAEASIMQALKFFDTVFAEFKPS